MRGYCIVCGHGPLQWPQRTCSEPCRDAARRELERRKDRRRAERKRANPIWQARQQQATERAAVNKQRRQEASAQAKQRRIARLQEAVCRSEADARAAAIYMRAFAQEFPTRYGRNYERKRWNERNRDHSKHLKQLRDKRSREMASIYALRELGWLNGYDVVAEPDHAVIVDHTYIIDKVLETAKTVVTLRDSHGGGKGGWQRCSKGAFGAALVQHGFVARDGGPIGTTTRSRLYELYENELEVRKWWASVPEEKKRGWLSVATVYRHWKYPTQTRQHQDLDSNGVARPRHRPGESTERDRKRRALMDALKDLGWVDQDGQIIPVEQTELSI